MTVVSADMRAWQAPEKADLLVSELLGSFGDNELSPECIDGAQRFLKSDGVSIPQAYTSYLALLSSSTLLNAVKALPYVICWNFLKYCRFFWYIFDVLWYNFDVFWYNFAVFGTFVCCFSF